MDLTHRHVHVFHELNFHGSYPALPIPAKIPAIWYFHSKFTVSGQFKQASIRKHIYAQHGNTSVGLAQRVQRVAEPTYNKQIPNLQSNH